jgi:hypothetical protein
MATLQILIPLRILLQHFLIKSRNSLPIYRHHSIFFIEALVIPYFPLVSNLGAETDEADIAVDVDGTRRW